MILFLDGAIFLFGMVFSFLIKADLGKKTACPRCKARFSALLIQRDVQVLCSRQDTMTYTGQAAIRDRNHQITGYVDEQRTMPVTVQTVVADRKYRCKTCGHRWEASEVGSVIV